MKKNHLLLLILITVLTVPPIGIAQVNINSLTNKDDIINEYKNGNNNETRIQALQRLGTTMIDKRINSLSKGQTLLSEAVHVDNETKEALDEQLRENINNLTQLKASIEQQTELKVLKNEVHSIITEYRIYLVIIPQVYGLAVINKEETLINKLKTAQETMEATLAELVTAGYSTNEIQLLVDEAITNIANAESHLSLAKSYFERMTVEDWKGAIDLKQDGRQEIVTIRKELRSAKQNFHAAAVAMKKLINPNYEDAEVAETEE